MGLASGNKRPLDEAHLLGRALRQDDWGCDDPKCLRYENSYA
jgi:hypothetical protein